MISIIAAVADDLGIGKDNRLLWHIPDDLKRFKKLTTGKCVIMGERTWESLPAKPLPNRKNIVLTDKPGKSFNCDFTAHSIEEALSSCSDFDEVFIIGGETLFRQFIPMAQRLYITRVHEKAPADTYFPEIDPKVWKQIFTEYHEGVPGLHPDYTYIIYEKK